MAFDGSCHCGQVIFTVDAELPQQAISCNCSHCRRKGFLLAFFPDQKVTVKRGENALSSYMFNKHKIEHRFCTMCGTQPFAQAQRPDGTRMRAINLRCVPAVDLSTLQIQHFDGASL